ncbi:hypothetical protein ACFLR5_01080, partial [Elusimicrobiota bacterium]
MNNKSYIKLAIISVLVYFSPLVYAEDNKQDLDLPKFTKMVLPSKSEVEWVIPVLEDVKIKGSKLKLKQFEIDGEGLPWFGYNNNTLLNFFEEAIVIVDREYEDFTWLDNGKFIMIADGSIGELGEMPADDKRSDMGLPVMRFNPLLKLPGKGFKVFSSRDNTIYIAGYNKDRRKYELYKITENVRKGFDAEIVLSSKDRITAVTGKKNIIYVARGKTVYRMTADGKNIKQYFEHPKNSITKMEYSKSAGLFYSTAKNVGFISDDKLYEFMKTSNANIRLRGNGLFIQLAKSYGILRISGLERFSDVEFLSKEEIKKIKKEKEEKEKKEKKPTKKKKVKKPKKKKEEKAVKPKEVQEPKKEKKKSKKEQKYIFCSQCGEKTLR